jgi:hypothetical protein
MESERGERDEKFVVHETRAAGFFENELIDPDPT